MNDEKIQIEINEQKELIIKNITESMYKQFDAMEKKVIHEYKQMARIIIPQQNIETDLYFKRYTLDQLSDYQNVAFELSRLNQLFLDKIENGIRPQNNVKGMI